MLMTEKERTQLRHPMVRASIALFGMCCIPFVCLWIVHFWFGRMWPQVNGVPEPWELPMMLGFLAGTIGLYIMHRVYWRWLCEPITYLFAWFDTTDYVVDDER